MIRRFIWGWRFVLDGEVRREGNKEAIRGFNFENICSRKRQDSFLRREKRKFVYVQNQLTKYIICFQRSADLIKNNNARFIGGGGVTQDVNSATLSLVFKINKQKPKKLMKQFRRFEDLFKETTFILEGAGDGRWWSCSGFQYWQRYIHFQNQNFDDLKICVRRQNSFWRERGMGEEEGA